MDINAGDALIGLIQINKECSFFKNVWSICDVVVSLIRKINSILNDIDSKKIKFLDYHMTVEL